MEKAWWALHKNAARYTEQIQVTVLYKTAVVEPLTAHLKNHPKRTAHCWRSKDELISNFLKWTLTHEAQSAGTVEYIDCISAEW